MRVLASVVSGVGLAALSACGSTETNALAPASQAQIEDRLVSVYQRIGGDAQSHVDANFIVYVAVQGSLRECMASRGFEYEPAKYDGVVPGTLAPKASPFPDAIWELLPVDPTYVAQHRLGVSDQLVAVARERLTESARTGQSAPTSESRDKAAEECRRMATATPAAEFLSPAATGLAIRFWTKLGAAVNTPAIASAMKAARSCLEDRGYGVIEELADLRASARNRFLAVLDKTPVTQDASAQEEWRDAISLELRAAQDDAQCRGQAHALALAAVGPVVDDFEVANSVSLTQTEDEWRAKHLRALELVKSASWATEE